MKQIAITTDSGICPVERDNTIIIPAQLVDSNGVCYKDGIDINNEEILNKTNEGIIFKTSSPIMEDYEKEFIKILENKQDIIHLSMGSGISEGSVNSASLMANILNDEYENKVYVVDTLTGATGGTLINEITNNLVNKNKPVEEIISYLEKIKKYIHSSFYVPDPSGFLRSGRDKSEMTLKNKVTLYGAKAAVMAGIKFRVDFDENGNLYKHSIMRGNTKLKMQILVQNIVNEGNKQNYEKDIIVVGNVHKQKVDLVEIKEYINNLKYFDKVVERDITGVVAAYGCDDLCGISLIKKIK